MLPPPHRSTPFFRLAHRAYRIAFLVIVATVSTSMTVQLFVAPDLSSVARTIDLCTVCWSALYKWCAVVKCDRSFGEFGSRLANVHEQAVTAYGQTANRYVADRMRRIRTVSYAYVATGYAVIVMVLFGPILTYPKGYVLSYVLARCLSRPKNN